MMDPKDFPPRKPAVAIAVGMPKDDGKAVFKAPEGFDTSDKPPGSTMEVVCEVTIMDGGMLELKSINGIPMEGGKPEEDEPKPADTFASRVMPSDEGEGE